MRIGITTFITDRSAATISPGEIGAAVEERGFDGLYLPEHTHIPSSRATPAPMGEPLPEQYWRSLDPFVALTAAAATTSRIRLGTGICLLVERDPIVTAKAVATLDLVSGGRFDLGIGFGWNKEEMADHGVAYADRRAVTTERLQVMRTLWEDDEASFDGVHHTLSPSWAWPKPAARIPVWFGGGMGPKNLAFLVEHCDGWIPIGGSGLTEAIPRLHRALEEAGRDPSAFAVVPFGSIPTPGKLEHFAEVGCTAVVCNAPSAARDEFLPFLDEAAAVVADHRG